MKYLLSSFILFMITNSYAYIDRNEPFDEITGLKCAFSEGNYAMWNSGKLKIESAKFGDEPISFDLIDHKNNTARMSGNNGNQKVMVYLTSESMTFIEMTGVGNFNFITVFPKLAKYRNYPAVMSRHIVILGKPMPSQYYGECELSTN